MGPWKPVSGEGRARPVRNRHRKVQVISNGARRRLSVIVVKKIDVNVNSTGILGIYGQIGANNRS